LTRFVPEIPSRRGGKEFSLAVYDERKPGGLFFIQDEYTGSITPRPGDLSNAELNEWWTIHSLKIFDDFVKSEYFPEDCYKLGKFNE